jgi:peptidoglycan hydrolase-like protein with peptidoglycan-binding domain
MNGKILDFVKWGLSHVKKATAPIGATFPVGRNDIGAAGEWEYIYGTSGEKCTQAILDRSFRTYYSKNGRTKAEFDRATAGWLAIGVYVSDCQGIEDAYSHAQTNADGNYRNLCTDKGLCSAINRPYVLGEAVFNGSNSKKTHVGWVCGFMSNGDVLVMECRGLDYGFIITQMSKRPWKYRGLMTKRYEYDKAATAPAPSGSAFVFTRQLQNGCTGEDVKELKKLLVAKGYTNLDVNNDRFLGETENTVKAFQKANGLDVDGVVGPQTYGALGAKYSKNEFIFTRVLKYGCTGDDVVEFKKVMVAKGYKNLDVTNNRFLGECRDTLKSYQRENGLTIDGRAGSKTYGSLGVKFKL